MRYYFIPRKKEYVIDAGSKEEALAKLSEGVMKNAEEYFSFTHREESAHHLANDSKLFRIAVMHLLTEKMTEEYLIPKADAEKCAEAAYAEYCRMPAPDINDCAKKAAKRYRNSREEASRERIRQAAKKIRAV